MANFAERLDLALRRRGFSGAQVAAELTRAGIPITRAYVSQLRTGKQTNPTLQVLRELEAIGPPVLGVHGNVDSADLRRLLPEERVVDAEGARIAMLHDAGPRTGRLERMRRRFGDCADLLVFGHSHLPLHEQAPDGFQIFNPGSPTERRRAPTHTMGLIHVADGLARCDLVLF